MRYLFSLLFISVIVTGCSWRPTSQTPAANVNTPPPVINEVSDEGRVFKSEEPLAPTTSAEYRAAVNAAWQAYRAAGGSLTPSSVAASDFARQQQLISQLYTAIVGLTVPAEDRTTHLALVLAAALWDESLRALQNGTPADQVQSQLQTVEKKFAQVITTSWLQDVTP